MPLGKGGLSGTLRFVSYKMISNASNFGMKLHVVDVSGDVAQGGVSGGRGGDQTALLVLRSCEMLGRSGVMVRRDASQWASPLLVLLVLLRCHPS